MLDELERSPLLADLGPMDRRPWRVAATVPLGAAAAIPAAVVGGALAATAFIPLVGAATVGEMIEQIGRMQAPPGLAGTLFTLALLAASNGAMALAFVGMASLLHKRRLKSYLTAAPRFRWRLMLAGLVLLAIVVGPLLGLSAVFDPKGVHPPILSISPHFGDRLLYLVAVIVLLLAAAASEELVFRGWLLKTLGSFTAHPLVLLPVSAGLFSLIHMDPNLDAFLMRLTMGLGLGWMALRLGGIEFAIGAHAANNILILLFLQPMGLKPDAGHPFPLEVLVIAPLMLVGYVLLAELAARWTPLRRWTGLGEPRLTATA
ncbi:MAG: CPBP family intramembrane metalloprotease [Caulobacter sp.]|nr:CPBP family intramembrane metalloprotease [Caulobacter sp.]